MKSLLFIILLLCSCHSLACDKKDPLALDAKAIMVPNSKLIDIEISAPHESKEFRLSGANLYQGENIISMYRGYEESGNHLYYLKGERDFLLNAIFKVTYTGKESLCAKTKELRLKDVLKNCNGCNKDI